MEKKYYRPDEVAKLLSISVSTVYLHIHAGKVQAVRVGSSLRIPASAINDYIKLVKK